MKILILTTTFPKDQKDYGTPRFVYDIAKNIADRNIKTIVLTPDRPNSKIKIEKYTDKFYALRYRYFIKNKQYLTSGEGIIPSIRKSKGNLVLLPFLIIGQLVHSLKLIKKEEINIINSHWLVPSGFTGALIQKFLKKKNYVTIHAAALYLLERIPLGNRIAKFIYNNSTRIFIVSNFGKKQFYKLLNIKDKASYNAKVKTIPMGIYVDKFNEERNTIAFPENSYNIIFLGRLVEKKGLVYAIEAIKYMQNSNINLHICGGGPLKNELEEMVEKYNLSQKIKFYGYISENEKINYFNSADILLVPSIETPEGDKEGLPVVILEALSAGLPIIATNVGGIKDGVINNYTGKLIEQKNSESIINAICELRNNKELYNDIRVNCKKYAKKFDWSKIADKYLEEIISSYNE